uniref:IMD domain-containing protein n=1 Tax=Lepeophtheirus salmonis TaxID=72036 RepID=A0A0K2UXY4_LEPSM
MKTFAGALLDCLSFPIQGKSEEWKKSTTLLEKEHLKCYKKNKSQIKKKTDQVLRLKKKLRKERVPDASLQRLFDQCSKELNIQFKNFEKNERHSVKKALTENRNHYSTFVAFLKPVLVEEIAMFTEIYPIEEVLNKLNRKTSQKESSDTFIQEYVQNDISNYEGDDSYSLYISTPPSTPLSSMGSRNASMSSLETNSTTNSSMSINNIPNGSTTTTQFYKTPSNEQSQSRPHSSLSFQNAPTNMHPAVLHRPCSTTAWDLNYRRKSHCLASKNLVQENEDLESINGSFSNDINGFSTVKRTFSPFYRVSDTNQIMNGVYMSQRCSSADRSMPSLNCSRQYLRCLSSDKTQNVSTDSGPHYATPKPGSNFQSVPNFHSDRGDMVIPHPIYMNCTDLEKMKAANKKCNLKRNSLDPSTKTYEHYKTDTRDLENELKTPTVEELPKTEQSFPISNEDGSSSSSDSFGSSSGYGSQYTMKLEENSQSKFKGQFLSSTIYKESSLNLNGKPIPPIRGSSMCSKDLTSCSEDSKSQLKNQPNVNALQDEDITPRGSIENIPNLNSPQNDKKVILPP